MNLNKTYETTKNFSDCNWIGYMTNAHLMLRCSSISSFHDVLNFDVDFVYTASHKLRYNINGEKETKY